MYVKQQRFCCECFNRHFEATSMLSDIFQYNPIDVHKQIIDARQAALLLLCRVFDIVGYIYVF